tara:strand:- start:2514 stop:14540 length:12027 start_codon:yes stop_codon:yes gene_type:complete
MSVDRVKFQDIVASQLPSFIRDDFPLLSEFLEQYYVSQETQGATLDLLQNIDKYVNIDQLTGLKSSTVLQVDISSVDDTIVTGVDGNFTEGFVDNNGLIKIDDEIIAYNSKTNLNFEGCQRGFSGTTSHTSANTPDRLSFSSQTTPTNHKKGAIIQNLNVLFLQEFFRKLKAQVSPGFGDRTLKTNPKNFIINSNSFYKSKGTDLSYKILFKALFGETVDIIRPSRFLLKPSSSNYNVTEDIVVKSYIGDPLQLKNLTLFQNSTQARGTVNNVRKIQYNDGDYYQLSIDSGYDRDVNVTGTTYGKFKPNPKTKLLNTVAVGATIMDVDSTVSFPESGKLEILDSDSNIVSIVYTGKSVTQFLNVSGVNAILSEKTDVDLDDYSHSYVGLGTDNEVRVRITSTLKDLKIQDSGFYNKRDTINIKSFGIEDESIRGSDWLVNNKSRYDVSSIIITDISELKYDVTTFDDHTLKVGYKIILSDNTGGNLDASIIDIGSKKSFTIKANSSIDLNKVYSFENQLLKVFSPKYSFLEKYTANVQNTYSNFNTDLLIATNSLPSYGDLGLDPYDKTLNFSGFATDNIINFGLPHGFYTGDAVYYQPGVITNTTINADGIPITTTTESKFEGTESGVFYIKKINNTSVKLSRSRSDLFRNVFANLGGSVNNNVFTYFSFYNKTIAPQGIYRKIIEPIREAGQFKTLPGYNGIFLNGVELLNYKSEDTIFYGPIKNLIVTAGGSGYDVVNPPRLTIRDNIGIGATGVVAVEGSLERIDIVDQGFDFLETPTISITGGNPIRPAKAETSLVEISYSVNINTEFNGNVNIGNNTIGFSSFHKFSQNEEIVYDSKEMRSIGGLSTNTTYFANVIDNFRISLHTNEKDSQLGINTITFNNTFGQGTQSLYSAKTKKIVSNIVVTDSGEGYKNKKRLIVGVVTATDSFKIDNHGFETGEIIQYTSGSTAVQGILENTNYFVIKIDSDNFRLSDSKSEFNNGVYVDIKGVGDGTFNYEPITVNINGITRITERNGQDFQCKIQPAFRGSIDSIDITNRGSQYGSSEIINLNREPEILFEGGQQAQIKPVINNGRFVDIIIDNSGREYISPPDLIIIGNGKYAKLTPIIENGKLVDVNIINPGIGYVDGQTSIAIANPGKGCDVESKINEWSINLFERNNEFVNNDDGFVDENLAGDKTEYCHLYTPRELRESTYVLKNNGDSFYGIADLEKSNGIEISNSHHSPIIGWAYDGTPIYGPYGYSTPEGGVIKQMRSGYELNVNLTNRPSPSIYPQGFFIEDFQFTGVGDLDVHNGRFCVTPDYPEGVYAYFTTLEPNVEAQGPFRNYKKPQFPYIIGDTFHSKRIEFNYSVESNQTDYDIQKNEWFRNTRSYNTNNLYSGYDYIFNSNKIKRQTIEVTGTNPGSISGVGIFTGGRNYQVGERVIFDNKQSDGKGAQARVSYVNGKEINTVSIATTLTPNVEFIKYFGLQQFIGFSSQPHNYQDQELVNVSGLSNYYKGFDGPYNVGVRSETFVTILGIGTASATGIATYLYVGGALKFPFIRPNDILGIGTEKVKVLNIEEESQRIRVLREQESTVGLAYSTGQVLIGDPRKFTINVGTLTTDKSFRVNEELYFDPPEAVGIGTTTGNGVGTPVTFRNPGIGATTLFIEPQSIYYKNHGLKLNDKVVYSLNGGTSIGVYNGISDANLTDYSELYVAPLTNNFIGISSHKVGMTTTGTYVGIGTTTGLLFFRDTGTGDHHSFKTVRSDILRTQVSRNIVTVSTATTHGLRPNNNVRVNIKPTDIQTIDVRFNQFNRRIVFNPIGFTSENVDTTLNTLYISNHEFSLGDKVVHQSSSPAGGLVNEKMYYVIPYSRDEIRLVEDKYQINEEEPIFVGITSTGLGGTISKINPLTKTRKNNNLKFDLSDPSLSFLSNGVKYPAFKMFVYLDQEFNKEFVTTGTKTDNKFEVSRSGSVGITSDANLTIEITDDVPFRLYYKFDAINIDIISIDQRGLILDTEVSPYNQINIEKSGYDGIQRLTGASGTSFTYELDSVPESLLYNSKNSIPTYDTDSKSVFGSISNIEMISNGSGYTKLPYVKGVNSGIGTNAILDAQTKDIGKILNHRFDSDNIGFDYPTDETLRPVANLPEILEMESLTSFESIGITSFGRNYLHPAKLVVIDGYTNKVIPEVDLRYQIGDTTVKILNNTTGMYDVMPRIIPTLNTNGVGISSIIFDSTTKIVRLLLNQSFQDERDFPFDVGSNILIENISVGLNTASKGYNSSVYEYTLFPVTTIFPQYGGTGAYIEYSLKDHLKDGEFPGKVEPLTTLGQVVAENDFPTFTAKLTTNDYFDGEKVVNGENTGIVESWTSSLDQLKVDTPKDFKVGTIIRGESSNTQSVVMRKYEFNAEITTGVGATIIHGWQDNVGFLNDNLQVIPNNEYYQNFSYSLSSKVPYDQWNDPVSNLGHTAGFAKFADYQLVSKETNPGKGIIQSEDANVEVVIDIIGEGDLNCYYNFDFVSEGTQHINGVLASNEIFFENRLLTDYFQSVGNRVLSIDDVSDQFNSNERAEKFSKVDDFESNYILNKIFTFVKDDVFTNERQFSVVNMLHNGIIGYSNEYGTISTYPPLGFYGYIQSGTGWSLTFNPIKFQYNAYQTATVAISLLDGVAGVGSTSLGDVLSIESDQVNINFGSTTTIASFPTSNKAAKLCVLAKGTSGIHSGQYHSSDINIVHDGTTVSMVEYGDIQTSFNNLNIGFGTYSSYIDGGLVKIDYHPSSSGSIEHQSQMTVFSGVGTSTGDHTLRTGRIKSSYTSIASSGSPLPVVISSYNDPYSANYSIVVVEDTTNNDLEMFELGMCNSTWNEVLTDWAYTRTSGTLGQVGVTSTSTTKNITFTPNPGIDVKVRTFGIDLMLYPGLINDTELKMNNLEITTGAGSYRGTKLDLKSQFGLKHKGLEIFRRVIDGSDTSTVSTTADTVTIPNHFFVTGEKLQYSHVGSGTSQAISIAPTSISGVTTDKLPETLYVIKVDEGRVRFAATAENALSLTPTSFDITGVGIGNSHVFTSTNQNAKALIAVDNMIQSPITETSITTDLNQDIIFDTIFDVTGITSFASGDIVRVDDEYMIADAVGIAGSTRFGVRRAQLGTGIGLHTTGATITKITGSYNITGSTVNFSSSPYGKTPLSTTATADPDSRDWTGITTSSSFQGRTFMRRSGAGRTEDTYSNNYVFDDISNKFNGIGTVFTLQNNGNNTTGYSTDNGIILLNNIFQVPKGSQVGDGTYQMEESVGVTSISFTGVGIAATNGYDPNSGDVPIGGLIISVGSESGFGYQPLVSAGGTVTVSATGSITNVSIANSGSGYRAGIQTVVNVGVQTDGEPNLQFIGTAAISGGNIVSVNITNPGSGYTSTNPPSVVFDEPLSYSNIPVEYSGNAGAGNSATVNIVVGQGSSVIDFEFRYGGYGYGEGEVLTVPVGGPTGIPTDPSLAFEEFQITIDEVFTDKFNGISIGQLQVLDKFDNLFNGSDKDFRLLIDGEPVSIQSAKGSNIEVDQTLLIFLNDILQEPGKSYIFNGGSTIKFAESPKVGDTSKVLFYKGSGDVDVIFTNVLETVKVGDTLDINNFPPDQTIIFDQEPRTVTGINTLDSVQTVTYLNPGITSDRSVLRPVTWCKQTSDKIINGQPIGKNRVKYEPFVQPTSYLIQPVGLGSTEAYVDNVRPLFDSNNESQIRSFQREITLTSQDNIVGASGTAIVSTSGIITSISITNSGVGYTVAPSVTIGSYSGVSESTATAAISGGQVTSVTITDGGSGYSDVPVVLFEQPKLIQEKINVSSYEGDYGTLVGFGTTTVGNDTRVIFDFFIDSQSFLRDTKYVGTAITVSGISTGDFFTIYNSNIGDDTFVSMSNDNTTIVGITTINIDGIWCVKDAQTLTTNVIGIGNTVVRRVFCNISGLSTASFSSTFLTFDSTLFTYDTQEVEVFTGGISSSFSFGKFSWGKINFEPRISSREFNSYNNNGYVGISSAGLVQRTNPLKFVNYI